MQIINFNHCEAKEKRAKESKKEQKVHQWDAHTFIFRERTMICIAKDWSILSVYGLNCKWNSIQQDGWEEEIAEQLHLDTW